MTDLEQLTYNGAAIIVTPETGRSYFRRLSAEISLGLDGGPNETSLPVQTLLERKQFAACWSQSEVEGDLGFHWPEDTTDRPALLAACESWLSLPGHVVKKWVEAVAGVNEGQEALVAPAAAVDKPKPKRRTKAKEG